MKRSTLVSQGTLNRIFQEVNERWKRHDYQAAIDSMKRAQQLDPANIRILLDLGGMHGRRYDYQAAEICFERAIRLSGKQTEVLAAAGKISLEFGNFNLAENYFKRAVEKNTPSPEVMVKLAEIYERLRRTDEAKDLIDRALHVDSTFAPALLLSVRLDRLAGRWDDAEKLLRHFPSQAEISLRASAAYELGSLLDRQGQYDDAMSAFLAAKELLRPQAVPYLAEFRKIRQRIREMQTHLNADILQEWLSLAHEFAPAKKIAFLVGHPRSGTTLLEQVLDAHPEITSLEETEIFHTDAYLPLARRLSLDAPIMAVMKAADSEALRQSRAQYFQSASLFLSQPIGNRILLDKNPALTFLVPVILRVFPEAKIILALRDPRDVILSCFMQDFKLGIFSSPYLTLEDTVEDYCTMMNLWRTLKPMIQGSFIEIRYEDMVNDLEGTARQTLDFLGLAWDSTVLGFNQHAQSKLVRSPTYSDVTQPVYQRARGRWHNYQKHIAPHLDKLKPFVSEFGYS